MENDPALFAIRSLIGVEKEHIRVGAPTAPIAHLRKRWCWSSLRCGPEGRRGGAYALRPRSGAASRSSWSSIPARAGLLRLSRLGSVLGTGVVARAARG